jgi:hypothetical protein
MRVRLDYLQVDDFRAGSRFYLSYAGAAPTAGNCATLATDISAAWGSNIAAVVGDLYHLDEVDVLDIASDSGNFGTWSGDIAGTLSGNPLPAQAATNVEFDIGRRYRGGKPRMYLPPGTASSQQDAGHWTVGFLGDVNTAMAAFIAEIAALSIGAIGTLAHVNVSYYKGFTNVTNSSGRTRAAPTYRDSALVEPVTGYAAKAVIGSQRRRRAATSY